MNVSSLLAASVATCAVAAYQPSVPDGATLSYVGAAHCGRYEVDKQIGREGIAWCEWPGENGRVRIDARCRHDGDALTLEGDHQQAAALAVAGTLAGARQPPFDTERTLLRDYVAYCEGRATDREALPLVGNDPSIAWIEHVSARPSGCRWLSLAPLRSTTTSPEGAEVVFDASKDRHTKTKKGGVPVLLADCCTGHPDGPPLRPLDVFMNINKFPSDPSAAYATNPFDWLTLVFQEIFAEDTFYDRPTTFAWRNGETQRRETANLVRHAVSWSTETAYKAPLAPHVFASMFGDGSEVRLAMQPSDGASGVASDAVFLIGERTRRFVAACAATLSTL